MFLYGELLFGKNIDRNMTKKEIIQKVREQHERDLESLLEFLDRNLPPFNSDLKEKIEKMKYTTDHGSGGFMWTANETLDKVLKLLE